MNLENLANTVFPKIFSFFSIYWPHVSIVSLLSIMSLPVGIRLLPADYFINEERRQISAVWVVLRNTLALFLLIAGILMLFLPGQGLLTIALALIVGRYPGKRLVEQKLVESRRIRKGLNSLRGRMGAKPFCWNSKAEK